MNEMAPFLVANQLCLGIIASGIGFVQVQSRFHDIRRRL